MLENLTQEQEFLMESISTEYENRVLKGDDSYNVEKIVDGINFIYSLVGLQEPEIIICNSPMEMAIDAELQPGETIDYLGNGYDSGWTAFYDFFQRIGILENEPDFDKWLDFITNSGVFCTVLCENTAFVCIRPCKVNLNSDGDLHSETEMAIQWRDGYGEYFLNGVPVDEKIVLTPAEQLDANLVVTEKNAEVRREIVRKIGVERICIKLGAKVLDKSDDGVYELLNLDLGEKGARPYLKMKSPSIPGVYHIEGVEPSIRTVEDALKWRNGTSEKPIILT